MRDVLGAIVSTVLSGELLLALPVAFAAGLIAFASPCVLPLVPGFLGYVSGFADTRPDSRRRLAVGATLFVMGFSAVFVGYGALFGATGSLLSTQHEMVMRVLGGLVIVIGLLALGGRGPLGRTYTTSWRPKAGLAGAPLLGATFGFGWTPCIGPTLSAVLTLSLTTSTASRGALLAVAYCFGIGAPLIVTAIAADRVEPIRRVLRRHGRVLSIAGATSLIVVGLMMVSGIWFHLSRMLQGVLLSFTPPI